MLPFKTRRTSQPQGAAELSSAPLAKGILIALPLGGSRLNSVGSDRRLASAVGAGSGVSAKGVAAKFSGSDYISLGTAPLLDSTTPCAFSIYEESFGTNSYTALLGLTASGSSNQFLFIRGSDPAYGCALSPANSATNARNFSGVGAQTAGERIRFFVTCANGLGTYTGIRVWANGVELSSGTTVFGSGAAGTSYLGWDGYDSKFNGLLSDFVLWGRVPSDAEIKAYFDSPGQIYAAQSRSLWIPGAVSVSLPTVGRPISDTSAGAWVPSTGGTLFACVDEAVYDDADYISVNSASMCEMALDTTAYPGGAVQTVSYRASSASGSSLTVRLRQAGTTIASWSHTLTGVDTLYVQTLTAPQIAALASGSVSVQLETS